MWSSLKIISSSVKVFIIDKKCLLKLYLKSQETVSHPPVGGTVTNWQSGAGSAVRCLGDSYCMAADLSHFEPHDIVVMAYNHHVVIHAQKVWKFLVIFSM